MTDMALEIAAGRISGVSSRTKYGQNNDIDTGVLPVDIWDGKSIWVPPTIGRKHLISSDSINDVGAIISEGSATDGSEYRLSDLSASFISDGVIAGDTILNYTTMNHGVVKSVSEKELFIENLAHDEVLAADGDAYKVVRATSTGAAVVHIKKCLNENMRETDEFVILNGTSNVSTEKYYYRINRMHIDAAASRSAANIGNITAFAVSDGTLSAKITAGKGQTLMAIDTVPHGKTGYMTGWYCAIARQGTTSNAMVDIDLLEVQEARSGNSGIRVADSVGAVSTGSSFVYKKFNPYKVFLPETDIIVRCTYATDNNSKVSAGFSMILEDSVSSRFAR